MNIYNLLTFQNIKGVGKKTIKYIAENYSYEASTYQEYLDIFEDASMKKPRIKLPTKNEIINASEIADQIVEQSKNLNIKWLLYSDSSYPQLLREIPDFPFLLFYKGDLSTLNSLKPLIAIIGTRNPSDYGYSVGKRLSEILTEYGFSIVSGLAKGCDTAAHEGCLNKKGKTIAVMAQGLDKIYPKENEGLAEEIIENNGCLVSEYHIGINPQRNTFIERDRIQSGLCKAIIVVETDLIGGTMHTVKFAREQKRQVAVLYSHSKDQQKIHQFRGNKKIADDGGIKLSDSESIKNFIEMISDQKKAITKNEEEQLNLF